MRATVCLYAVLLCPAAAQPLAFEVADAPDLSGPASISQAVQQQLGLKLEARKMPADLVVVDSGQKTPIDN